MVTLSPDFIVQDVIELFPFTSSDIRLSIGPTKKLVNLLAKASEPLNSPRSHKTLYVFRI